MTNETDKKKAIEVANSVDEKLLMKLLEALIAEQTKED